MNIDLFLEHWTFKYWIAFFKETIHDVFKDLIMQGKLNLNIG